MADLATIIADQAGTCAGEEGALVAALASAIELRTFQGHLVRDLNDLGPYIAGVVGTSVATWIQGARASANFALRPVIP